MDTMTVETKQQGRGCKEKGEGGLEAMIFIGKLWMEGWIFWIFKGMTKFSIQY